MSERIYWDDFEKQAVIDYGAELLEQKHMSLLQAFKRGQEKAIQTGEISGNRRRNVNALAAIPWFKAGVEKIRINKTQAASEVVAKTIEKKVNEFSTDEIIDELVKRFTKNMLKTIVSAAVAEVIAHNPIMEVDKPAQNKVQKKKIAIVGLLPEQANTIKSRFGNDLDITFLPNHGGATMESKLARSDAVFLMTKFISHSCDYIAQKVGLPIVRVQGAVSNLIVAISEWVGDKNESLRPVGKGS